jgi:hypothetical protein
MSVFRYVMYLVISVFGAVKDLTAIAKLSIDSNS